MSKQDFLVTLSGNDFSNIEKADADFNTDHEVSIMPNEQAAYLSA